MKGPQSLREASYEIRVGLEHADCGGAPAFSLDHKPVVGTAIRTLLTFPNHLPEPALEVTREIVFANAVALRAFTAKTQRGIVQASIRN